MKALIFTNTYSIIRIEKSKHKYHKYEHKYPQTIIVLFVKKISVIRVEKNLNTNITNELTNIHKPSLCYL